MRKRIHGSTLIELMMTLLVAGILLVFALPAFEDFTMNNRIVSQTNRLVSSFQLARAEAVKRGVSVRITATDASNNANEWGEGWSLWVDTDGDGTMDTDEVIRTVASTDSVIDSNDGDTEYIYSADGLINTGDTITICDSRTGETGRTLTLSLTGSPSSTKSTCP